jgi:hypothetical protein
MQPHIMELTTRMQTVCSARNAGSYKTGDSAHDIWNVVYRAGPLRLKQQLGLQAHVDHTTKVPQDLQAATGRLGGL